MWMGRCEPVAFLRFVVGRERCTFSSAQCAVGNIMVYKIALGVEGIHAVILRPVAPKGAARFFQTRDFEFWRTTICHSSHRLDARRLT